MSKLIDFLTFKDVTGSDKRLPTDRSDDRLRKDERDVAILAGKYPAGAPDIESISEYRLASLMQYPHY